MEPPVVVVAAAADDVDGVFSRQLSAK